MHPMYKYQLYFMKSKLQSNTISDPDIIQKYTMYTRDMLRETGLSNQVQNLRHIYP